MWTCPKCERIFEKTNQPHSCQRVSLESHFVHKEPARELFDFLLREIEAKIGKCQIVALPCCVHLFGKYDFLTVLPKKEKIEIRFALDRVLATPRLKVSVPVSIKFVKNCVEISSKREINGELLRWVKEAYFLKD